MKGWGGARDDFPYKQGKVACQSDACLEPRDAGEKYNMHAHLRCECLHVYVFTCAPVQWLPATSCGGRVLKSVRNNTEGRIAHHADALNNRREITPPRP